MFACLYSPSASRDILEGVARAFSPRIEPGGSIVLLDISGLGRLLGEPHAIAEELQQAVLVAQDFSPAVSVSAGPKSRTTSTAIAGTRTAAQLLARSLPGITVIDAGTEAAAVAPLPLGTLAHLGAPPDLLAMLDRWGLLTLGAFAALPSNRLASRIGQHGLAWQKTARGEDARPLIPTPVEERFEAMHDLDWPIEGIEPLAFVLGRLLDPLCARLELRDRAASVVELRLRLTISRTWQLRRLELPTPMRDPRTLRTLLCLDLEGRPIGTAEAGRSGEPGRPGEGIDRIGLFLEPTPARAAQFSLLSRPTVAPEAVATLMARLRALMGQDRCGMARLLDTHRPGAFAMEDFAIVGPTFRSGAASSSTPSTQLARALRRLRHPIPARVILEHGRPVRVVTDRRGWSGGGVTWCSGPWRASGDWWKEEDRFSWQEWDVALSDGAHYRIHEDRQRSHWFINAILD